MRALALLALAFVAACSPQQASPPPVAPDDPTAYPDDSIPEASVAPGGPCDRACAVLAALHCPEGAPSRNGTSCGDVCRSVQGSGLENLRPNCVAAKTDVAGVRWCGVRCER